MLEVCDAAIVLGCLLNPLQAGTHSQRVTLLAGKGDKEPAAGL